MTDCNDHLVAYASIKDLNQMAPTNTFFAEGSSSRSISTSSDEPTSTTVFKKCSLLMILLIMVNIIKATRSLGIDNAWNNVTNSQKI